ncbi:hypothetical protein HZS_2691 [Henneguya salminicola]|nr:hypothetical protein HZS_2691 [Henneguya salminicola]
MNMLLKDSLYRQYCEYIEDTKEYKIEKVTEYYCIAIKYLKNKRILLKVVCNKICTKFVSLFEFIRPNDVISIILKTDFAQELQKLLNIEVYPLSVFLSNSDIINCIINFVKNGKKVTLTLERNWEITDHELTIYGKSLEFERCINNLNHGNVGIFGLNCKGKLMNTETTFFIEFDRNIRESIIYFDSTCISLMEEVTKSFIHFLGIKKYFSYVKQKLYYDIGEIQIPNLEPQQNISHTNLFFNSILYSKTRSVFEKTYKKKKRISKIFGVFQY